MKTTFILIISTLTLITSCKKDNETPPVEETPVEVCNKPTNLGLYTMGPYVYLHWDNVNSPSSSYYQYEYGVSGFTQGSGTILTTSSTSVSNISLATGNAYQFYVRGYCDVTGGYSAWTGPFSYYSNENHNMCIAPSNVQYTVEVNGFSEPVAANFTWTHNGETSFEYTIVANNATPQSGNIHSIEFNEGTPTIFLTQNTEYDFYVRSICLDGTPTSWVGPKNVNIGG